MTGLTLQQSNFALAGPRQCASRHATASRPRMSVVQTRNKTSRSPKSKPGTCGRVDRHICQANDRTAAPVADKPLSPDGTAVLENSEQFAVHLKAAILDPKVTEHNQITPEVQSLVDELKCIQPKDRKKITKEGIKGVFKGVLTDFGDRMSSDGMSTLGTISFQQFKPHDLKIKAEGTGVMISTDYENQYSVNIPFTIQEGPLAGMQGVQSTIGEYTIEDSEPVRQKIGFTALSLGPNTSDSAAKQKWLGVMREENVKMDEDGKILLKFPEPMKGFRDFLYFDEQLQISIGNRGSLTIIQQEA